MTRHTIPSRNYFPCRTSNFPSYERPLADNAAIDQPGIECETTRLLGKAHVGSQYHRKSESDPFSREVRPQSNVLARRPIVRSRNLRSDPDARKSPHTLEISRN